MSGLKVLRRTMYTYRNYFAALMVLGGVWMKVLNKIIVKKRAKKYSSHLIFNRELIDYNSSSRISMIAIEYCLGIDHKQAYWNRFDSLDLLFLPTIFDLTRLD